MDSSEEKKICIVEKTSDAKSTDEKPWLSRDNGTLASAAVKLMISIVVSSSVSTIAFILKNNQRYDTEIMCFLYGVVVLMWIALMSLVFFKFMWSEVLKDKPQHIKAGFAFGMAVNFLAVFSAVIYACATFRQDVLLFIMLFIGVFNSMLMFMFHDMKVQNDERNNQRIHTHKIFDVPKYFQVFVEGEQGK